MTPIVWLTRLLVGAYPHWQGCAPSPRQRIYFANHTSHLDTIVIWASLPPELRRHVHPVAAKTTGAEAPFAAALPSMNSDAFLLTAVEQIMPIRSIRCATCSVPVTRSSFSRRHSSPASRAESLQVRHLALDDGIPACGIYSGLYREPPPRYA